MLGQQQDYKKIDQYVYNPNVAPLGKGAFAAVYKAYDEKRNNCEVAVKVIPATKLLENEEQYNLFMREIDVLRQIKGDNIVHLLDVKRTSNNLYIFTDFCNGGDLEKKLKKEGQMTEDQALAILKQMTSAFILLDNLVVKNSKGQRVSVMHRDIKPANILFNDGEIRIGDFGFAKLVDENTKDVKQKHTLLGTPLYMNPQTLDDQAYTVKCDVWSSGVVFYECLFGKLPWTARSIQELLKNIRNKPLEFPKPISDDTKDLLKRMLIEKEESRIDWKGISEHPAIKRSKMPLKTVTQTTPPLSTGLTQTPPTSGISTQPPSGTYPSGGFPVQGGGYPTHPPSGGYPTQPSSGGFGSQGSGGYHTQQPPSGGYVTGGSNNQTQQQNNKKI
jgi:serine/threonine protein kinase